MTVSILQQIEGTAPGGVLKVPAGEYVGNIVIDRPITIQGTGRSTWIAARTGPVIRIVSAGVTLRDIEVAALDAKGVADPGGVAIAHTPGAAPQLERVSLAGDVIQAAASAHDMDTTVGIRLVPPPPLRFAPPRRHEESNPPPSLEARGSAPKSAGLPDSGVSPVDRAGPVIRPAAQAAARSVEQWSPTPPKAVSSWIVALVCLMGGGALAGVLYLISQKNQQEPPTPSVAAASEPLAPDSVEPSQPPDPMEHLDQGCNLREEASTNSGIVAFVRPDVYFWVDDSYNSEEGWRSVTLENGVRGYLGPACR